MLMNKLVYQTSEPFVYQTSCLLFQLWVQAVLGNINHLGTWHRTFPMQLYICEQMFELLAKISTSNVDCYGKCRSNTPVCSLTRYFQIR